MGWASNYIEKLQQGEEVLFRPRGSSMKGRIESGQLCKVVPINGKLLMVDDIVLCKVHRSEYLHLIKAVHNNQYLIGNNRGGNNGWIYPNAIFGYLISIEDWNVNKT